MDSQFNQTKFTHTVNIHVGSVDGDEMVGVKVTFDPDITGDELIALGYSPACITLLQDYIWPAIEQAKLEWELGPLMVAESPSTRRN